LLFLYGNNKTQIKGAIMKKACLILMVLSLALVLGCGSSATAQNAQNAQANTPPWLNDSPPDDVIWGVGVAKQSSESMSMTTAEARARVSVARLLNTRVQAMFTDYNQDAGNAGSQVNVSLQEDVSRQVTNMDVSGAQIIQRWKASDGTWWYLVQLNKSDALAAISRIIDRESASFAEFKTQQALSYLDAQIAKNEKPLQVDN
jgi:hypothetical protein